jgi:hypothetical protein
MPARGRYGRFLHESSQEASDARLISEFMALANRNEGLRKEVIAYIEESRAIQVKVLRAALERRSGSNKIPPAGLAILASSAALSLIRETELGVSAGHREIRAMIDAFLSEVEPQSRRKRSE